MKNISNISQNIIKILVMVLLVVFLSACGEDNDLVSGDNPCSETGSKADNATCIDVQDTRCLGCNIFALMFNAVSINVMRMHGHLTQGAMALMMVCFSVWLALRLLKFVSSVSESSISQVWNEILKQGFLCLFCGILASSPSMLIYVVKTFVYPIYASFLKLGIAIMETSITDGDTGQATIFNVFGEVVSVKGVSLKCTFDELGIITEKGFPPEFLNTIKCMINVLRTYLAIGGKISGTLMRHAPFSGKIAGFVLMLYFLVVRIGFVFYLVDTIFQMGIVILILPVFIMAYAFKSTRSWTTKALNKILASAGFLMCFSIIVVMTLRAMIELIKNNPSIFNPTNAQAEVSSFGIGFLCLLLIGFLIYSSMSIAQQITGSLINGKVDKKFQEKLTKALDMVKGWALSAGAAALSYGVSFMPNNVQEFIKKVNETRKRLNRLRGKGLDDKDKK